MHHITLPVFNDQSKQWGPDRESLEVEDIGNGRLRLLHSPAFVDGLACGDIFILRMDVPRGCEVLERGGNIAIVVAFLSLEQKAGEPGSELRELAARLDGWCEGGPGRILVLSVPLGTGLPRIEHAITQFCAKVDECMWWFGNVYEPDTGQPLEWWKNEATQKRIKQ